MRYNEFDGGATKTADKNWIGLVAKSESIKVPFDEVLYIEQVGKNLLIHKEGDTICVPGRVRKLSKALGEPFYQCHSYLLINLSKVYLMANGDIVFDNQQSTHIGQASYIKTRKKFNQYLLGE